MDDPLALEGRRIVVTGAGSGIGLAVAGELARYGARLALLDRDAEALARAADGFSTKALGVDIFAVDVIDEAQVDCAFHAIEENWNGIDVLIHAAGIMREQGTDIRDISLASWNSVIGINLTGSFLVARAACRIMIPRGAGTLILVGSPAGVVSPSGSIPYGGSKGGVNGLAMTLQKHLAPHGLRVHNFLPGSVNTPLYHRSLDEGVSHGVSAQAAASARAASVEPAAVAQGIALLASPRADYLQGPVFSR